LTGKRIGGEEAFQLGLVDGAFSEEELLPQALAFAKTVAKKGEDRRIFGQIKRQMYHQELSLLSSSDPSNDFLQSTL
jgi:enoyl-CoA hydratase/carnithine racemase